MIAPAARRSHSLVPQPAEAGHGPGGTGDIRRPSRAAPQNGRACVVSGTLRRASMATMGPMSALAAAPPRTVGPVNPWDLATDVAELPDRATPRWVAQELQRSPQEFAALLRAHLVPAKKKSDSRYQRQFRGLWRAVAYTDRRLRSRILKLLHEWQEQAESALAQDSAGGLDRRAVEMFARDVAGAIARVHRDGQEPMAWGGNEFVNYPTNARVIIEALAVAIDEHRDGQINDEQLWSLLGTLGVDPQTVPTDSLVPDDARRRIIAAARDGQPLELGR